MQVAVLGLGEAGGQIAAELVTAGCDVRAWDPARRPEGIPNAASDREAVRGADVALVGIVPGHGLAIPALASGAGAERFAELFRPLGMPVEVVGERPGDAAGLKLLRSVFMKGIAAAAIESIEAARAAGVEGHVRADIAGVLGEPLLDRLLACSRAHAARRMHEMQAAAAYVEELGVEPRIATAAAEWLAQLRDAP